jgi:rod shape-determining protein MreC
MAIYSMGRRRIIALLLLSSILLITLDIRGNAAIDRLRGGFSVIMTPFDSAARAVSRPIVNAWNGITDYERLQRENEALQEQIDRQRGAEIEAGASILDFQELLLLSRLESASSYPTVIGEVQGASPSNFRYTVEINKGSLDGIGVGMPVVNQAGLVGKITSVNPSSSIVLLITDPDFSIGAKVLTAITPSNPLTTVAIDPGSGVFSNTTSTSTTSTSTTASSTVPAETTTTIPSLDPPSTDDSGVVVPVGTTTTSSTSSTTTSTTLPPFEVVRETGTLSGQGKDRPLILRFVDASSTTGKLQVGSRVQTAGGNDSIAPANLPIGTVRSVSSQSGSSVPVVEVELAADLTKLNYLTVLLYTPSGSAG